MRAYARHNPHTNRDEIHFGRHDDKEPNHRIPGTPIVDWVKFRISTNSCTCEHTLKLLMLYDILISNFPEYLVFESIYLNIGFKYAFSILGPLSRIDSSIACRFFDTTQGKHMLESYDPYDILPGYSHYIRNIIQDIENRIL